MVLCYRRRRFGVECGCGLERGQVEQRTTMFSESTFLEFNESRQTTDETSLRSLVE
jgi:hypothetical protein